MRRSTPTSSAARPTRRQALAGLAGAAGALGFQRAASAQDLENAITQTASFKLVPGKEDEAVGLLAELVAAVEANEPGVLAYICHRQESDPSTVFFFEIYKDAAALEEHGKQPHLAKLGQGFGTVFAPPVDIQKMTRIAGFSR